MINNINDALNAYQTALNRIGSKNIAQESTPVQSSGFGDLVKDSIAKTTSLANISEATTLRAMQGKADIQDVVLAVANAETALETVVAVRDTAIKAYNSIISMQI